jgi:hypothetical protein
MALQVDVTIPGDLTVTDAYVRIADVTGVEKRQVGDPPATEYWITYRVEIFKDQAQADGGLLPLPVGFSIACEYDLNASDNALVQIYTHLKTLDNSVADFTQATDVLE